MLQPKESLDNATNTTNKIDYNKLSCKEVDSKIKEFKSILMTTKMSKEKRNELEKDLKNAEIYYAKNCMVVSEQPQQQQQQQQENNTTNQKPTTKGSSSMIKMFLVLGLIGGAIYMLQRKK
jgi:thiol:disulfide interchange protein